MTKRVYFQTVMKWLAAVGASAGTILGLFFYLSANGMIDVHSYTPDYACAGTEADPCIAEFTFTALDDVFIYPTGYDPWGRDDHPVYFDKDVKSYKLQRSWGESWRTIDLSKPWSKKVKYAWKLKKNQTYTMRLVVEKIAPSDEIKWGFSNLDPVFLGVWDRQGGDIVGNWSFGNMTISPENVTCFHNTCVQTMTVCNKRPEMLYLFGVFDFPIDSIETYDPEIKRTEEYNKSVPTYGNVTHNYVCNYTFNYTYDYEGNGTNYSWCYTYNASNQSTTIIFEHDFGFIKPDKKKIWWQRYEQNGTKNITLNRTVWNDVADKFTAKNKSNDTYYFNKNGLNIGSGVCKEWRFNYNPAIPKGKWNAIFALHTSDDWTCLIDESCFRMAEIDPAWVSASYNITGQPNLSVSWSADYVPTTLYLKKFKQMSSSHDLYPDLHEGWKLDETGSDTVAQGIRNDYNCTYVSSPNLDDNSVLGLNTSFVGDGSTDKVLCGNIGVTAYPFTMTHWLYYDSSISGTNQGGIILYDLSAGNKFMSSAYASGGYISQSHYNGGGTYVDLNTYSMTGKPSGWYYIATVYENNNFKLYVNGILAGTNTGSYSCPSGLDYFSMGYLDRPISDTWYTGPIDEVYVFNKSLSATEVSSMYYDNLCLSQMNASADCSDIVMYNTDTNTTIPFVPIVNITGVSWLGNASGIANDTLLWDAISIPSPGHNGNSTEFNASVIASYQQISTSKSYYGNCVVSAKLDETGSNTTAEDFCGINDGTYESSPDLDNTGLTGFNTNMEADGSADFINIPDDATLSFGDGSDDEPFSVNAWVYMHDASFFTIVDKTVADDNQEEYFIGTASSGDVDRLYVHLMDSNTANKLSEYYPSMTSYENTWTMITFTYDGSGAVGGMKGYYNGVEQSGTSASSGSYTAMENGAGSVKIGKRLSFSTQYADGLIDEFSIFNNTLTSDQIQELYDTVSSSNIGFSSNQVVTASTNEVPNYDTVLSLLFEPIMGESPTKDYSGNGYDATIVNDPEFKQDSDAQHGNSENQLGYYEFDGGNDYMTLPNLGLSGTSARTVAYWYKSTGNNEPVVTWGDKSGAGKGFLTLVINAGTDSMRIGAMTCYRDCSAANSADGNWHHYLVTLPEGGNQLDNYTMYLDGVARTSCTDYGGACTLNTVEGNYAIGTRTTDFFDYYTGDLDNIKILNRSVTADEALGMYGEPRQDIVADQYWSSEINITPSTGWDKVINTIITYSKIIGLAVADFTKVNGVSS